jgi:predicted GIY-YIG superfamily endonuclease
MTIKKNNAQFDKKAIRDWMLYAVKLNNGHYYVGITARKDFMRRIKQHGGRFGAKVNRGNVVDEIIELQHLGRMTGLKAQHIENDVMLQYRKRFGAQKVRGGYEVSKKTSLIPTYTPGSIQSFVFIAACLTFALLLLIFIATK